MKIWRNLDHSHAFAADSSVFKQALRQQKKKETGGKAPFYKKREIYSFPISGWILKEKRGECAPIIFVNRFEIMQRPMHEVQVRSARLGT